MTAGRSTPEKSPAPPGLDGLTADDCYDSFCAAIALRQLRDWLPHSPGRVLDVSLPLPDADPRRADFRVSDLCSSAGHQVFSVTRDSRVPTGARRPTHPVIIGDGRQLDWIRNESLDIVVAEGSMLSSCLAAEETVRDIARVLRPGGRLLASADSLLLGLARLAEQHRWPELADAHVADVVLVPRRGKGGGFLRCFGPDELREMFSGAGLAVDWVRPRTVLPAAAIRQTLGADPSAVEDLLLSELSLDDAHEGEAHGGRLVVSARKPGPA